MASISVVYRDAGLKRFDAAVTKLAAKGVLEQYLGNALTKAGDKMRTMVRRALKAQTGVKRYGAIVNATRSFRKGLAYEIVGTGRGFDIKEFPVRANASRSRLLAMRWSRRDHWKLQARRGDGRFGKIKDVGDGGAVRAAPWAVARVFRRSFVDTKGRYRAMIESKGKMVSRPLYGAAVWKEIVKGQTLRVFEADAPRALDDAVSATLARFMP